MGEFVVYQNKMEGNKLIFMLVSLAVMVQIITKELTRTILIRWDEIIEYQHHQHNLKHLE